MDFEQTRFENDERLLEQIESIKSAENIQVLIPFAKAYLGMFYVIDSELAEKEKVKLLASETLAEAIFAGFLNSLNLESLPTVEKIGHAKAQKEEFSEGYVILAGLDLLTKKSFKQLNSLNSNIIETAVAFHFSNKSSHINAWYEYLSEEHKNKVIPAVVKYWVAMLKNKASYLPGIKLVLGKQVDTELVQASLLPLLSNWKKCKVKTLSQLLHLSFQYSKADDFLVVCEKSLEDEESLNERTRLYWLIAAYFISPDKYFAKLSNYIGRVKLKIMPLLDFSVLILQNKDKINVELNAIITVQLLRMIAPVFPPQQHVYGAIGALDINSKNIMLLFYHLADLNDINAEKEIKSLRKVRVMKIYSAVIDNLIELRACQKDSEGFSFPSFDEYISLLIENNCLQSRSNKFDLR